MALENLTACPICNSTETELHKTIKDYTVSQESFTITKCKSCNFLYTNPRPTQETLGSYYKSEDYISHTNKSNSPINLVYKLARTQTLKWKLNLVKESSPTNLLDYGCGTGHFLTYAKSNNLKISGFEPDEDVRKIATLNTSENVYSDTKKIKNSFDAITLWHVLEHISNLNDVMLWLKDHLTKNGKLIIAVPNAASHDASHFQEHWAAYDVPRHLYHFTKETLTKLANKHSFCIESIHPMKLDSFYVSLLSNKQKYKSIKPINSFVNGFKSNIYAKKSMNYSSLIYVLTHEKV